MERICSSFSVRRAGDTLAVLQSFARICFQPLCPSQIPSAPGPGQGILCSLAPRLC